MSKNPKTPKTLGGPRPEPPKYCRVRGHLEAEMVAGRLAADDALPTEVVLARHFGVGRNTVRHALAELERDGLVRRIRGKGTYVQKRKMPVVPRRTDSLALVMNDTKDPAHATLLQGFEAAGRDLQLHTLVCGTENDVAKQGNVLFHLLDSGVPGVALVPTTDEPTPAFHVRQLQRHGIPVVLCHRDVDDVRAPRIPIPFGDVGRRAGEAFLEHGHQSVACFCSHPAKAYAAYHEGLREAMRAGGGDLTDENVFVGDSWTEDMESQEEAVLHALKRMRAGTNCPTAIFASSDPLAELIYLLASRLGLSVPEDMSLVSEGGPWREGAIARLLTSVIIPEEEIGQRAVELLQQMRAGERPIDDTETLAVPLRLIEGSTLGPPRKITGRKSSQSDDAPNDSAISSVGTPLSSQPRRT